MLRVYPDYFYDFACIAERCTHNCCIGWEIDIDADTAALYQALDTPFGRRLRAGIATEPQPHFALTQEKRCPFLNRHNLCDIITELGEEALCDVCYLHPRFHNEGEGRLELGLGLSCEAAAALILRQKEPMKLLYEGEPSAPSPLVAERDALLARLGDRRRPIAERIGFLTPEETAEWIPRFLALERLEEAWTELLYKAQGVTDADLAALDTHMKERQTEYEQLALYLIYRHYLPHGPAAGALPAVVCSLLRQMAAAILKETGDFTFAEQVELCRLFSAEIEYSDSSPALLLAAVDQSVKE